MRKEILKLGNLPQDDFFYENFRSDFARRKCHHPLIRFDKLREYNDYFPGMDDHKLLY